MNLSTDDLIRLFRSDVDDRLRGPADEPDVDALWKVDEVMYYLNAAASRVAVTTFSLQRTFDVPITAAAGPLYRLPAAYPTLDIHRAYLRTARHDLLERNLDQGNVGQPDYGNANSLQDAWDTATGVPRYYTREYREGYLRLLPAPATDDVLTITATVDSPTLTAGAPLPFTNLQDIHLVLVWMKHLAYSKKDVDTFDPARADRYSAEFETLAKGRKYEAMRVRRAPGVAKFSW